MSFLAAIRNGVHGVTHQLEKNVKGRWSFFVYFVLTFGVIQLITLTFYFFAYYVLIEESQRSLRQVAVSIGSGELSSLLTHITVLPLLFSTAMIHAGGGYQAKKLNFGQLFQQIKTKTVITYLISLIFCLSFLLYFAEFYDSRLYFSPYTAYYMDAVKDVSWFVSFFKSVLMQLATLLPLLIVAFSLVIRKVGAWNFPSVFHKWKEIIAVVLLLVVMNALYFFVLELVSQTLFNTFILILENDDVAMVLGLIITFFLAVLYHYVTGFLVYFSINPIDEVEEEKKPILSLKEDDLLDQ